MNYKKWLIKTALLSFSILLFIGSFNYFIDPLWMFNHSHEYNDIQEAFNERQQKTNDITFHDFNFDSLLLGSSRSTYINQNEFRGYNAYNYSVSSMSVQEYNDFTEYAKSVKGSDFDTIFIGLDFFVTSKARQLEDPTVYINQANQFFYRYKTLLSADTFFHSIKNAIASYKDISFVRHYNRENIANVNKKNHEIERRIENTVTNYKETFYGKTYEYNEDYVDILNELKLNNRNTQFVVFTTPVSAPLFNALVESNRLNDYKRWLKDVISVFGEVHHFMYINSVTEDISNYYDGHHFYPSIGTLIAHKLINYPNPNLPKDFGVILTEENINTYFLELEKGNFHFYNE